MSLGGIVANLDLEESLRKAIDFIEAATDVQIVRMEGAGHMLTWDAPERTVEEINSWIRSGIHRNGDHDE